MKKIALISIILILTIKLSGQNFSFTDSLNIWNIGLNCVDENPMNPYNRWSTYFVHIEGDTLFNNKHYKKLFHCVDSTCINKDFKSYIREESGKAFLADKTRELLLYDFNLKQGDSLIMYFLWDDRNSNPLFIQVDSVKSDIFQDQKERSVQYVTVYAYNYREYSFNDVFVEGIGSMRFGLEYPINLFVTGGTGCGLNLLCFYTDKNLVYTNPEFNDCYVNSEVPAKNPSHDYQTVYSNRVALFENSERQIKALRIDSVKVETDSVFYPFATIQEISKNCFSPYKASWIGEKVVVKPDGTNLFFNRDGDTITLKTRARVNETWIVFKRADNFRVKATMQSVGLENFLGLTDSVKTISFTVTDQNENTVDHELNKLKVKISKKHGFVETLNFYLFPDITVRYPADRLNSYSLVGLTNPKAGVQNLTWFEVNDFQPGDELHVLEENSSWDEWNGNKIGFSITTKSIIKYLKRYDYMDSIVYLVSQNQSIQTIKTHTDTIIYNYDTTISVIKPVPQFDKLPGEPIIDEWKEATNYHMETTDILSKSYPGVYESIHHVEDSCWEMAVVDGCFRNETYFKGFGGPYYTCTNCCSSGGEKRKLVYYKKGETEWGEKLVITSVSDIKTSDDLKVFPNPADAYITISNPSNIEIKKIEMFDFSGRVVQQWAGQELAGNQLNIKHILPGIYLLKAETNARVKTEKLVVN